MSNPTETLASIEKFESQFSDSPPPAVAEESAEPEVEAAAGEAEEAEESADAAIDSDEGEAVEASPEDAAEDASAEAAPTQVAPDAATRLEAVIERQAALIERLIAAQTEAATPKIPEAPKAPSPIDQYRYVLNTPEVLAREMGRAGLDPTNVRDVLAFKATLENAVLYEELQDRTRQIEDTRKQFDGWKAEQAKAVAIREQATAWAKATEGLNIPAKLGATLTAAVSALVDQGLAPAEAVQAALDPFLEVIPKKAKAAAKAEPRKEVSKAVAAAALTGRGASKPTGPKKGSTAELEALEGLLSRARYTRN